MEQMGCKLSREITILPSMCDGDLRLAVAAALDVFQDTATLHADHFDIGPAGMERRNYFWIITKTRIHINRLPKMMERVTSSTWIQAADRASCERDFSIACGDELLAYGRSIWAVISRDTGRLVHMSGLYPDDIEFDMVPPDDRPFLKLGKKFDDAEPLGEYTVRSVDVDLGGHMNNVNYVRAMLGCFSTEEIEKMDIRELEVNFISQTYEGETLRFVKRTPAPDAAADAGASIVIGALSREGKAVFLASIR